MFVNIYQQTIKYFMECQTILDRKFYLNRNMFIIFFYIKMNLLRLTRYISHISKALIY